jgi:hypothetical protein
MKKPYYNRKKSIFSQRNNQLFLLVALVAITGEVLYFSYKSVTQPIPQSPKIFMAESGGGLSYGVSTQSGVLRKDSPLGVSGQYLLILPSGQPILLNKTGLDYLVGKSVTVSGTLNPGATASALPNMDIKTIISK